jgi:hypothetical protein
MNLADLPEKTTDGVKAEWFKYTNGSNVFRLIADAEGRQMMPFRVHWIDSHPKRCTNFDSEVGKFNKRVCKYCSEGKMRADNADTAVAVTPDMDIVLIPLKPTVRKKIMSQTGTLIKLKVLEGYKDLTSPVVGPWWEVVKSGKGVKGTTYEVEVAGDESMPIDLTEFLEDTDLPDLGQLYPAQTPEEQVEAMIQGGHDVSHSRPLLTVEEVEEVMQEADGGNTEDLSGVPEGGPEDDDDIPF